MTLASGEVAYTSRGGYKVVRWFTATGNTIRIREPSGGWLCSMGRRSRVLSFRSVATAAKRADKEGKRLAGERYR